MSFTATSSKSSKYLLLLLALAALTNAQLTDLPTLTTDNEQLGATTSASSSRTTPSASRSQSAGTQNSATPTASSATDDLPALTTSAQAGGLTNAPTLYGVGVPPLIVPDTSGAPFMTKSSLPEGFVFICVGAILAFLGLSVVAWRSVVAWSLHRSVQRAASERYVSEKKSVYGAPTNYSSVYQSANVSLEHLAAKDTSYGGSGGSNKLSKSYPKTSQRQSRQPPGSSLFFSPTAGGGQRSNRTSAYLPSGYYASGASAIGGGSGIASFGGPPAAGYGRVGETFAESPPPTGGHDRGVSRDGHLAPNREQERSRGNGRASGQHGQRAPSAVLDELFDHHTSMR